MQVTLWPLFVFAGMATAAVILVAIEHHKSLKNSKKEKETEL